MADPAAAHTVPSIVQPINIHSMSEDSVRPRTYPKAVVSKTNVVNRALVSSLMSAPVPGSEPSLGWIPSEGTSDVSGVDFMSNHSRYSGGGNPTFHWFVAYDVSAFCLDHLL